MQRLTASVTEEAELASTLVGRYRGTMVSVTQLASGAEYPGMSLRADAQAMTPPLITPEVLAVARGAESTAVHGNCFCAEQVSVSNIARDDLPTHGAVSIAMTVGWREFVPPCPHCQRLLKLAGMSCVDRLLRLTNTIHDEPPGTR